MTERRETCYDVVTDGERVLTIRNFPTRRGDSLACFRQPVKAVPPAAVAAIYGVTASGSGYSLAFVTEAALQKILNTAHPNHRSIFLERDIQNPMELVLY